MKPAGLRQTPPCPQFPPTDTSRAWLTSPEACQANVSWSSVSSSAYGPSQRTPGLTARPGSLARRRDPPPDDVYSRPSYLAIDLSKTTDLSSVTIATDMDEYVYTREFLWTPESTMAARGQRDKMDYVGWVRAGYLQTTPGPIIDYEALCLQIQELIDLYNIQAMCYDRWKIDELLAAAKRVNLELTKFSDRPGLLVMPHSQSFQRESKADNPDERPDQVIPLWMPKSIEATERLILQGKLKSAYNPLVRSAVLGAVVLEDGSENRKFAKDRSTRRIDPCVSKAMAVGLLEARKPIMFDIGSFIPRAQEETDVRH